MHKPPYVHNTFAGIFHRVVLDTKDSETVVFKFQARTPYGTNTTVHNVFLHTDDMTFEFLNNIEMGDSYILMEKKDDSADSSE